MARKKTPRRAPLRVRDVHVAKAENGYAVRVSRSSRRYGVDHEEIHVAKTAAELAAIIVAALA